MALRLAPHRNADGGPCPIRGSLYGSSAGASSQCGWGPLPHPRQALWLFGWRLIPMRMGAPAPSAAVFLALRLPLHRNADVGPAPLRGGLSGLSAGRLIA